MLMLDRVEHIDTYLAASGDPPPAGAVAPNGVVPIDPLVPDHTIRFETGLMTLPEGLHWPPGKDRRAVRITVKQDGDEASFILPVWCWEAVRDKADDVLAR